MTCQFNVLLHLNKFFSCTNLQSVTPVITKAEVPVSSAPEIRSRRWWDATSCDADEPCDGVGEVPNANHKACGNIKRREYF